MPSKVTVSPRPGPIRKLIGAGSSVEEAMAAALNATAFKARKAGQDQVRRAVSQPTSWIVRGVIVWRAASNNLSASVAFDDGFFTGSSGVTQSKILDVLERGGQRGAKPHEILLRRRGVIGPGEFVMPAKSGPFDRVGGRIAGMYQRLLSDFKAQRDPSQNSTTASRRRKRKGGKRFFRAGNLILEREREGEAVPVLVVFRKTPTYQAQLGFVPEVTRVVLATLPGQVRRYVFHLRGLRPT